MSAVGKLGAGADEPLDENGSDEKDDEGEEGEVIVSMNVPAPNQYDRDEDIRRAWRFSARPTGSGRGGATGAPAGGRGSAGRGKVRTADDDGTGNWKKAARNKVKDRERSKLNAVIKESW